VNERCKRRRVGRRVGAGQGSPRQILRRRAEMFRKTPEKPTNLFHSTTPGFKLPSRNFFAVLNVF
jgi:hypothetical protein